MTQQDFASFTTGQNTGFIVEYGYEDEPAGYRYYRSRWAARDFAAKWQQPGRRWWAVIYQTAAPQEGQAPLLQGDKMIKTIAVTAIR